MNRTEFKRRVKVVGECWLWQGSRRGRYGQCNEGDEPSRYAHRLSFRLWKGPIPTGMDVLHKCDTPLCVRPKHLWAGTKSQNQQDAVGKGRKPYTERQRRAVSAAQRRNWQEGRYEFLRRRK